MKVLVLRTILAYAVRRELTAGFLMSSASGFLIWALSPSVTGSIEPWDSTSRFYIVALVVTGLIAGYSFPRKIWPVLLGVAFGQFLYMLLFVAKGPLIGVGVLVLFIYGLLSLGGAFVGALLRRALRNRISMP